MKEFIDIVVELPDFIVGDLREMSRETGVDCPRGALGLTLSGILEGRLPETRPGFATKIRMDGCFVPLTAADVLDCVGRGESVWLARCRFVKLSLPLSKEAVRSMESFVRRSRKASAMDWYDSHLSVSPRMACAIAACEALVEAMPRSANCKGAMDRSRPAAPAGTRSARKASPGKPVARRKSPGDVLPRGCLTPIDDFAVPVFMAFEKMDGLGRGVDIKKLVKGIMDGKLNDYDLEQVPSSPAELRWHKTVHCLVDRWKKKGYVDGHGHTTGWRLTDAGWAMLREILSSRGPGKKRA